MAAGTRTRIAQGEIEGRRFEMASRPPCAVLQPFVRRIVGYDERAPGPRRDRQLPEPFYVLIIEIGPPLLVILGGDERHAARHAGGFVAGLGDAFAFTEHRGRQCGIQVDLTPTGARRFFDRPLCELRDRIVALHDLLPAEHRTLSERLEALPDWGARLDRVEALLARRILGAHIDTRRVDWAVARIEDSGGALPVGELASELGYSRKHLISLFHDQVGIAPKRLARLVRFERVLRRARSDVSLRWAELALACGYSDQAHLAREVRHFTGLTPREARRELPALEDLLD